mmetsp:Transcript_851/g.1782  ORF Transcript_851/g.1782 Transcript_851/m.1782 type:complete len:331 (+) Transcript_851:114-1106(+)
MLTSSSPPPPFVNAAPSPPTPTSTAILVLPPSTRVLSRFVSLATCKAFSLAWLMVSCPDGAATATATAAAVDAATGSHWRRGGKQAGAAAADAVSRQKLDQPQLLGLPVFAVRLHHAHHPLPDLQCEQGVVAHQVPAAHLLEPRTEVQARVVLFQRPPQLVCPRQQSQRVFRVHVLLPHGHHLLQHRLGDRLVRGHGVALHEPEFHRQPGRHRGGRKVQARKHLLARRQRTRQRRLPPVRHLDRHRLSHHVHVAELVHHESGQTLVELHPNHRLSSCAQAFFHGHGEHGCQHGGRRRRLQGRRLVVVMVVVVEDFPEEPKEASQHFLLQL